MEAKSYAAEHGTVRYWVDHAAGEGSPWLVFLPGLTADHRMFPAQMAHFSGRCNCLTWDAPAHGESRPYPLNFSMDDYARILNRILRLEGAPMPVLIGQSLGGYIAQAYMDLYPGSVAGFISIDSAPLKRRYYPDWELALLRHTKGMYLSIPWKLLKIWGSTGVATTPQGRANMREFMDSYSKSEFCNLAAHGYKMLADAICAERPYEIDCPALLICGKKDWAGDVRKFNRKWTAGEGIPLVWVPDAGHNANVDAPEFVNDQIEAFISKLEANGRFEHLA